MNSKARAKFAQIAILLEEKGPEVQMPYSKHLEDGIFEVRVLLEKILPGFCISFWKVRGLSSQMGSRRKRRKLREER